MTMNLTEQEIRLILGALNSAQVQGLESMQAVLALANKLQTHLVNQQPKPEE